MRILPLILAATLAVALAACKKDAEPPVNNTPTTGTLGLSWGFHWGDPDLVLGETYTDDFGHALVLDTFRYFVSDFQFMEGTNTVAHYPNTRLLFDAVEEGFVSLGTVNPLSFDTLQVTLGLDSATNHLDPSSAPAPLNDMTMHWGPGTANGYYFLVITGRVDDDGDGTVDANDPAFTYRCATDALRRRITKATQYHYSVAAGSSATPHLHVHVNELMAGIDVLNNLSAIGGQAVNVQLMDQLIDALEVE